MYKRRQELTAVIATAYVGASIRFCACSHLRLISNSAYPGRPSEMILRYSLARSATVGSCLSSKSRECEFHRMRNIGTSSRPMMHVVRMQCSDMALGFSDVHACGQSVSSAVTKPCMIDKAVTFAVIEPSDAAASSSVPR